jgi:hypothetical protein
LERSLKHYGIRVMALAAVAALAACSGGNSSTQSLLPMARPEAASMTGAAAAEAPVPRALLNVQMLELGPTMHRLCEGESRLPGHFHCDAIFSAGIPIENASSPCLRGPGCYGPADLQAAYGITNLAKTKGAGRTVAIVDAFGYPGIQKDLATYRSFFGLPPCTGACFKVVNQSGKASPLPKPNSDPSDDWRGEQALDIDMVSAICPKCSIVLVQANSDGGQNLQTAVKTALKMGGAVSNSWGGNEYTSTNALFDNHPGHVVTASAGDSGAGASQPCSFAGVVCVGGTSLVMSGNRRIGEVVWDGLVQNQCGRNIPCATGSGCSAMVAKPSWQRDAGCTKRSESDVSADADPYTGVVIACSPCAFGGHSVLSGGHGGTSASSPIIAAMYVLAGNYGSASPKTLWAKGGTESFYDVVKGTNQNAAAHTFMCSAAIAYICTARKGYDGPTGWGSPHGLGAL